MKTTFLLFFALAVTARGEHQGREIQLRDAEQVRRLFAGIPAPTFSAKEFRETADKALENLKQSDSTAGKERALGALDLLLDETIRSFREIRERDSDRGPVRITTEILIRDPAYFASLANQLLSVASDANEAEGVRLAAAKMLANRMWPTWIQASSTQLVAATVDKNTPESVATELQRALDDLYPTTTPMAQIPRATTWQTLLMKPFDLLYNKNRDAFAAEWAKHLEASNTITQARAARGLAGAGGVWKQPIIDRLRDLVTSPSREVQEHSVRALGRQARVNPGVGALLGEIARRKSPAGIDFDVGRATALEILGDSDEAGSEKALIDALSSAAHPFDVKEAALNAIKGRLEREKTVEDSHAARRNVFLQSHDDDLRKLAFETLGAFALTSVDGFDFLVGIAADPKNDEVARAWALKTIANTLAKKRLPEKTVEDLAAALKLPLLDANQPVFDSPEFPATLDRLAQVLRKASRDDSEAVRAKATQVQGLLAKHGHAISAEAFTPLLKDESLWVRLEAVLAASRHAHPVPQANLAEVVEALDHKEMGKTARTVMDKIVLDHGPFEPVARFLNALASKAEKDPQVQPLFERQLKEVLGSVARLYAGTKDHPWEQDRAAIARFAEESLKREALPVDAKRLLLHYFSFTGRKEPLLDRLTDSREQTVVRLLALQIVGGVQDPDALLALHRVAAQGDPGEVQEAVREHLSKVNYMPMRKALSTLLAYPWDSHQWTDARLSVLYWGEEGDTEMFRRYLLDPNPVVRKNALAMVSRTSNLARSLTPELVKLAEKEESRMDALRGLVLENNGEKEKHALKELLPPIYRNKKNAALMRLFAFRLAGMTDPSQTYLEDLVPFIEESKNTPDLPQPFWAITAELSRAKDREELRLRGVLAALESKSTFGRSGGIAATQFWVKDHGGDPKILAHAKIFIAKLDELREAHRGDPSLEWEYGQASEGLRRMLRPQD